MEYKINGAQPFQVLSDSFSISPSNEGYTLQVSADGVNYSDLFSVASNTTKMCTGMSNGSYYRLNGNESEVVVNWRTECKGSGGGGVGPQGPQGPQGPAGAGDSGQVQTMINESISTFSEELQAGQPIVGMANQLYSPDGVTSDGRFNYRTTAGDEDVATGDAELRVLKGNSDYSNVTVTSDVQTALYRSGDEVTGFTCDATSGEIITYDWEEVTAQNIAGKNAQVCRNKLDNSRTGYPGWFYSNGGDMQWQWNGSTLSPQRSTVVDLGNGWWRPATDDGARAYWDGEWLTIYLTGVSQSTYITAFQDSFIPVEADMGVEVHNPNDILTGEYTYTYDGNDWSPSLPLAISNMQVNGSTYTPQSGDELVITKTISVSGLATSPTPSEFVALGLNSFDYECNGILTSVFEEGRRYIYNDEEEGEYDSWIDTAYTTYSVYAVTGLENGYIVHYEGGSFIRNYNFGGVADTAVWEEGDIDTHIDFSNSELVNGDLVVYPTTAMPYIIFSVPTEDADKICVHPRWSGKMDEGFEEYSESVIDISSLVNEYPLISVGNVRNEIRIKDGVYVENIELEEFSSERVAELDANGKHYGIDYQYDEDYIYIVSSDPGQKEIGENEYTYKDNDFSVEYFTEDGEILAEEIYAETYYVTNLVDKLRRLETYFIHLDDPNASGQEGKTYEYDGRLMKWVEGSGNTAEWLKNISGLTNNEGTGLIYSIIPDGQVLFEFKYQYGSNWRQVVYSNNTLYLLETGGTVVCAVTIGNTFQFTPKDTSSYNIKGVFTNGYIGFRKSSSISFQNVWIGNVNGGHYELLDKANKPYVEVASGIPFWNENGQITRIDRGVGTKNIYFNTSGSPYNAKTTFVYSDSSYGPERMFVPTVGGTQGQTLVSNGANAEPVWESRIKVVKITSADYDALVQAGTTDPNTLYAIDDNV